MQMLVLTTLILIFSEAVPFLNNLIPVNGYIKISSIVLLFCAILTFNTLYFESIDSGITIYGGLFNISIISQFIDMFMFLIAAFILIAWPVIKLEKDYSTNYCLIIILSILGSSLLVSCYDLISLFLSLELQSLAVYVLATLNRNSELSTSAGLKYFLLGALSSCFILLGSGLIYSYTGLTNFESIYMLIQGSDINNVLQGFFLGLLLIFVGFLFKIAAAPLHN
jgi:NADH-ubiquinone oxidoreductase chain 2